LLAGRIDEMRELPSSIAANNVTITAITNMPSSPSSIPVALSVIQASLPPHFYSAICGCVAGSTELIDDFRSEIFIRQSVMLHNAADTG
jgi:hypothetical protein